MEGTGGTAHVGQTEAKSQTEIALRPATVQQAYGIITNNGDFVLAGGSVNIQKHFHYHPDGRANLESVLRLVRNFRKIHLDALSKATPGTGAWLFKIDEFLIWMDVRGGLTILWGTGIPGAGKTVLASIVINELEARATKTSGSICVAYIFFRYSDAADLTIRHVLEILVKQTVERHPNCVTLAEQAYDRHLREDTQPTEAELFQLLHQFAQIHSATFYILDALDEAPYKLQVALIKKLSMLNVRLFITSRPLKAVEAQIPDVHSFAISAQDGDLNLHIAQEIACSRDLQDLLDNTDPSVREEIVSSIKKNCGGMFLHASLQLDAISQCSSLQDVKDILADFPAHIDDVYHRTWQRICGQTSRQIRLAKTVLVWVLNVSRSMTVDELRHAVAASHDQVAHNFEPGQLVSETTLITLCCGLVVVEEESRLVRLVHYTAKDILQGFLRESFPHPDSLLASVCLSHLHRCSFQTMLLRSDEEFLAALLEDPLLAYASDSWASHTHRSLDVPKIEHQAAIFVRKITAFPAFTGPPPSVLFFDILDSIHVLARYNLPWAWIDDETLHDPNTGTKLRGTTPLTLAAWHGHDVLVQTLLSLPRIQPNQVDNYGFFALWFAARFGHQQIVEHLLAWPGIQVNLTSELAWSRSALMTAAHEGHSAVLKLLLAHPDTLVNLVDNDGWSAVMKAASQGHEDIVRILLAHPDIKVNLVSNEGSSALMLAAGHGRGGVAKVLLAYPTTKINMVDRDGWSALMHAAQKGHVGIVSLLLARPGVLVNLVDNDGWSALMKAASRGHDDTIRILLAHTGIHANPISSKGSSALMLAAGHGHNGAVKLLLAHPATKCNHQSPGGWSALMHAAQNGHLGNVTLLLAHPEVLVDLVDNEGWSALMKAASQGHEDIVQALLAHPDIDVNLVSNEGSSALMLAAGRGRGGVVKLLLAVPAMNCNHQCPDGWSALMHASQKGHVEVVLLLLSHPGILVNLVDNDGWSALMKAASQGHEDTVRILLACPDIQVNLVSTEGSSALMLAAGHGQGGVVNLLFGHPLIQRNMVDRDGWSALMFAAHFGHDAIVALFLQDPKVEVALVDHDGRSAGVLAARNGHIGTAVLLLQPGNSQSLLGELAAPLSEVEIASESEGSEDSMSDNSDDYYDAKEQFGEGGS